MDKISQLPQPIQHHILSFLEEREVNRTACLSKTWGSIFQSRPVLVFNKLHFEPKPGSYKPRSDIEKREWKLLCDSKESCFINHVEESIQRTVGQDLSIQRFSLKAGFDGPVRHKAELDRWVQQLVEAKVEDFSLLLYFPKPHLHVSYRYMLPPVVFLSETLTNLRLSACDLEQCRNVRLPNLLELRLKYVTLSREAIDGFASGFPNLEILKLDRCHGLSSVHVSGLDRLTTIELNLRYKVTEVKIVAPRLRVFNVSSRYEIDLPILLACESSLRKFELQDIPVSEKDLESLVSRFLELEELILSYMDVVSIKIPNLRIVKLKLNGCRNLETVDINGPNLRVVEYYHNKLPFYSMNSSFSPNNVIDFHANLKYSVDPFKIWTDSVKDSLKDMFKFGGLKNMKLMVNFRGSMDVFVFQELDEEFINMSYDGKDPRIPRMTIEVMRITSHKHMAYHLFKYRTRWENVYIISRDWKSSRIFVKVLNKNIVKEKEESHFCIPRIRRWQRSPQHAEIANGKIETPSFLKPFDTTKCKVTCIKLQWNSRSVQEPMISPQHV